jgi:iron complex outermembrane receptor protein
MSLGRTKALTLALALVVGSAFDAHAQQRAGSVVSGSVLDESGATLPGASVNLSGSGVNRFQTTGGDGAFTFNNVPAGSYKLTVSLGGFRPHTAENVAVSGEAPVAIPAITLNIALQGEEVVVTATKAETTLVNAPATMTVIGQETLQASPAQNYGDLLRSVPGMNVIQMSARDVNITSRQATSTLSNSQLALLDGRSIYLDFFGLILWDFVPANADEIKQIEVVRGPASAVWGANALTGVINIITKSPREAAGTRITLSGGTFTRDAGSTSGQDAGTLYGGNISHSGAPNDTWSYRVTAGYFNSDPYPRPSGRVKGTSFGEDCRPIGHPQDPTFLTGCAQYPPDRSALRPGEQAYQNRGTSQPRFEGRLDQELGNGGRITYNGGYAGTEGIVHTGIGPFDLQSGSYLAFGRVAYQKNALKVAAFGNFLHGDAPNLLSLDATTGQPLELIFDTQTYDLEIGNSNVLGGNNIITYGGNVRRNSFDMTIAPAAEDRTEFGAYLQDEIFFDRFRFTIGGRVDKFGNIDDPVFSPRLSAMFKPTPSQSIRASYNRAFRSPSAINNYLDVRTFVGQFPVAALAPALNANPATRPVAPIIAARAPLPIITRSVGNVPAQIGSPNGHELKEESLTAYEVGYTGTIAGKTTLGLAFYINDTEDSINFVTDPCRARYTAANPPPGWDAAFAPLPPAISRTFVELVAAQGTCLPAEIGYFNLGKMRNRGVETSIEHSFNRTVSLFGSYSWQDEPEPLDDDTPAAEITLPPTHRVSGGVNLNHRKFLGQVSVNYTSEAFWTDVLGPTFAGPTDSFTMVNASFGVRWMDGKLTTTLKGTNIFNADNSQGGILQHNFGDIITRTIVGELRLNF